MTRTAAAPRRCAVAAHRGYEVGCPPGGCLLARRLDHRHVGEDEPCVVELLAGDSFGNPLVVFTLDELRRELERDAVA